MWPYYVPGCLRSSFNTNTNIDITNIQNTSNQQTTNVVEAAPAGGGTAAGEAEEGKGHQPSAGQGRWLARHHTSPCLIAGIPARSDRRFCCTQHPILPSNTQHHARPSLAHGSSASRQPSPRLPAAAGLPHPL